MKILGSDYDGTLTVGGINETKIAAIQKWRAAGNRFGIVSGRGWTFRETLRQSFPLLELDFFVACNGAHVTDGAGEIIYEARCNTFPAYTLINDLLAWNCKFIHVNGEEYICLVEAIEHLRYPVPLQHVRLINSAPPIEYFHQISVELLSVEEAAAVTDKIREKYGKWLTPLQNGICIDIVPLGANKAQGLYRVMEFFGCTHKDVITVGDNLNDMDMIREFYSYAMKNAVPEIQRCANELVGDVTEIIEKEL